MALAAGGDGPYPYAPYCGAPPTPEGLLGRWNLDPPLIFALLAILAAYVVGAQVGPWRWRDLPAWRRGAFLAGWVIACLALVSPLCALSVSLFSARIGQHMILAMAAAPLVALGLPPRAAARPPAPGLFAATLFAAAMWVWHAPGPYEATFASVWIYWLMHLTAFAAALVLWRALLDARAARLGDILAAGALTSLQMAFLGAVLAFAGRPIYAPHLLTSWAWGLAPLQDQQLGAVIMWVPAGTLFVAVLMAAMALAMRRLPAEARS